MSNKFAKKGHLVVDVTEGKKPRLGVVGQEESRVDRKGLVANLSKTEKAEKPAKVSKGLKSAEKEINAKLKKIAKAEKEPTERAPRGQYADKKIKVVNKKHEAREGSVRAALMEAILSSKTTNEALAKTVETSKGKEQKVSNADIAFAISRELISVA